MLGSKKIPWGNVVHEPWMWLVAAHCNQGFIDSGIVECAKRAWKALVLVQDASLGSDDVGNRNRILSVGTALAWVAQAPTPEELEERVNALLAVVELDGDVAALSDAMTKNDGGVK